MSASARIRVWPAPILLGVLSTVGLMAALLSDGMGDYLSWLTLTIPVAVVLWYAPRRKASSKQRERLAQRDPHPPAEGNRDRGPRGEQKAAMR